MNPSRSVSMAAWAAAIIAFISLTISAWMGYVHAQEGNITRLTVLETQRADDHERLLRVEATLDKIYQKIKDW